MKKNKYFFLLIFLMLICFFLHNRCSLDNIILPLKYNDKINYIRFELDKGPNKETEFLLIEDEKEIGKIITKMKNVNLIYGGRKSIITYESSDQTGIIFVHINSPDNQFVIKSNGKIYYRNKYYISLGKDSKELYKYIQQLF